MGLSQQLDCNMSAGLGIGQGMMVIGQVITAGCGNCLQLMVRQTASEMVTGGRKCIIELILGIIHLIHPENLFQTSFIEPAVVSHKRKSFNLRGYLFPDTRKNRSIFSIFFRQPVDLLAEPLIVFRLRMYQTIERVHNLPVTDDNHSNAAHAGTALIGCLEINCCKILHTLHIFVNANV